MVTLNKIIYPTDFSSTAKIAFETAQRLARDSNASLLVVHVVEPTAQAPGAAVPQVTMSGVDLPADARENAENARERLEKVKPDDEGIRVEHRLLEGAPSKEIPEFADNQHADLIVMGTHGRTGLRRLLMGSVAEAVVRNANCPVLTIRQSASDFSEKEETATSSRSS